MLNDYNEKAKTNKVNALQDIINFLYSLSRYIDNREF